MTFSDSGPVCKASLSTGSGSGCFLVVPTGSVTTCACWLLVAATATLSFACNSSPCNSWICVRSTTNSWVVVRVRCSLRFSSSSIWSATPDTCSESHLSHCCLVLLSSPLSSVLCSLLFLGSGCCSCPSVGWVTVFSSSDTHSLPMAGNTSSLKSGKTGSNLASFGAVLASSFFPSAPTTRGGPFALR